MYPNTIENAVVTANFPIISSVMARIGSIEGIKHHSVRSYMEGTEEISSIFKHSKILLGELR